ncbi:hypothetical protein PUNSTDRAFT_139385 [Punctularia strigosozonata HHB-11173 SS5]|uniref:DNA-directed DNA polymerase n=1 Tax=Punctularia strigosozonata (strain HHB-11173) TaxID=741275 RepID=R7S341_PUNST|nr:uncharacterized protein PUNSTDRAFT_139385 [Punctularia strigosozonata HHB-11173 SS5]EIN03671.1 hypothetical protein PUNSTDRAFT_139385 [Punctularia strigosozonata HHB-11173 SS5]
MSIADELTVPPAPPSRATSTVVESGDAYKPPSFTINASNRSYKHQYANIYFVRLRMLRKFVEDRAQKRWEGIAGSPVLVPRVLDVVKSQLCYIVGTVYMDMPLKPNVLEDIGRHHSIPVPPPREKFYSETDCVMLEDESGRVRLVGKAVTEAGLVTGVILGALGIETPGGDFEVVDLCYAGMAPQVSSHPANDDQDDHMDVDDEPLSPDDDEHIALVSGLEVGSVDAPDAEIQLLIEYLTGEASLSSSKRISRLIIAGNSVGFAPEDGKPKDPRKPKKKNMRKYGQPGPASFSPKPINTLAEHLLDIASAVPIHILPGEIDPSGTMLPQQKFPRAMLGPASRFSSFHPETNPTYLRLSVGSPDATASQDLPGTSKAAAARRRRLRQIDRTLLVHSGQPLDDMFKYLPTPPFSRLAVAERTLRWRHMAPTAPDTLWCHPYFSADPFVIAQTPDVYVIGNQPEFRTKVVADEGPGKSGARVRIVLVPRFSETGLLVLVNLRTLGVSTVRFDVEGMASGERSRLE